MNLKNIIKNEPIGAEIFITERSVTSYLALKNNLRNIYESDVEWLKSAIMAYDQSITNNGIMTNNDDFYKALIIAIGQWKKFNLTNYQSRFLKFREASLNSGMSKEEATKVAKKKCKKDNKTISTIEHMWQLFIKELVLIVE